MSYVVVLPDALGTAASELASLGAALSGANAAAAASTTRFGCRQSLAVVAGTCYWVAAVAAGLETPTCPRTGVLDGLIPPATKIA
ncbi:PE domain-containing protein [Mycobacterium bourgelatii]|uniref:PE domain-containing protein n=1 Tax=Mycobacterium bourgelatii TaxID=1273442 RepID=A0A7I9YXV9_MYCBU|nr:PE domain-containing protein [Mycobacterium bourgelatii]MCV6974839.1 PE domain-containing protein [Mycobacterium bourgelatii]GFG93564.1 hypothetical protein MBOU_56060 [Mycobacterium bourgelatii]